MKARYQFLFNRRNRLDKNGCAPVDLFVYMSRDHRAYVSTGIHIKPEQWDVRAGMPRQSSDDLKRYTKAMIAMQRKIEDEEIEMMMRGENLRPWHIKRIMEADTPKASMPVVLFFEKELEKNNRLTAETKRSHKQTLTKLTEYNATATMSDADFAYIDGFDRYMISLGLHHNTIEGHHRRVRKYMILAEKYGILKRSPYRDFKLRKLPTNKQALTQDELDAIGRIDYTANTRLQNTQRVFLFACYTGLRYNEIKSLKLENCILTSDGYEIVLHEVRKYPTPVFLPLGTLFKGKANEILSKHFITPQGMKIPITANTQVNRALKEIAYDCRLQKPLTFHIARHTFGTLLGAATGDAFLVKALMGHQDIKTSMVYVKETPEIIRRKVSRVAW